MGSIKLKQKKVNVLHVNNCRSSFIMYNVHMYLKWNQLQQNCIRAFVWTALKFKHLFELFYIKKEMKLLIQDFFKRILTVYTRIEKIFMFAHIYTIKDDNTLFGLNSQWNSIYIKIVIFNYQFLSNRRNLRKKSKHNNWFEPFLRVCHFVSCR